MKLIDLLLLQPVDCYGRKPDGSKFLIKDATRDAPAIYVQSELESYKSTMVVEIDGDDHTFELFVSRESLEQTDHNHVAMFVLREFNHMVMHVMQDNFNKQLDSYMKENPHAPR